MSLVQVHILAIIVSIIVRSGAHETELALEAHEDTGKQT